MFDGRMEGWNDGRMRNSQPSNFLTFHCIKRISRGYPGFQQAFSGLQQLPYLPDK